jgi:hypothetical protein
MTTKFDTRPTTLFANVRYQYLSLKHVGWKVRGVRVTDWNELAKIDASSVCQEQFWARKSGGFGYYIGPDCNGLEPVYERQQADAVMVEFTISF